MELSPTAYVILGMLGWRPMSGYEIKSIVDKSTRFFWAASYGQIYPELRRLSDAGLIEGEASPQGGRKRNVYRLTTAGRKELRAWLGAEPAGVRGPRRGPTEAVLRRLPPTGSRRPARSSAMRREPPGSSSSDLKAVEAEGPPAGSPISS